MNASLKLSSFKVADQFPFIVFWASWLCSSVPKPDAGSTEDMQQSQYTFERLLEMWLTFWQAGQLLVFRALMCFCPWAITPSHSGAGTEISRAEDVNSHEMTMVNFWEKTLFQGRAWTWGVRQTDKNNQFISEWEMWAWDTLCAASALGRGGCSHWAADSCFQRGIEWRLMSGFGWRAAHQLQNHDPNTKSCFQISA